MGRVSHKEGPVDEFQIQDEDEDADAIYYVSVLVSCRKVFLLLVIRFRAEKLTEMGHDGTRESLVAKSPIIIKTWKELSSAEKDVRTLPAMVLSKIC